MLKKTITYTDFNGNERTEDFFFNFTDAELTEYNFSFKGGIEKKLEDIIASENMQEILEIFKDLILLSYGKKSEDGRRFIKNDELREEFSQTAAFSKLYMELLDDTKAAEFINGIVPSDKKMTQAEIDQNVATAAEKLGIQKPETTEVTPEKATETPVVDMPKPTQTESPVEEK